MKLYHQQGAELGVSNQGIDINFGENNIYHQIDIAYAEFEITLRKIGNDFKNLLVDCKFEEPIRLVRVAFVHAFNVANLSITGDGEVEVNKYCGHFSKKLRIIT